MLNPAKVKADARALDAQPRHRGLVALLHLDRRPTVLLLCLLTAAAMIGSFPPWDLWPLAYVALVPWSMSLVLSLTRRWALLSAWLGGLVFWAAAVYWLSWVTLLGYAAGVIYVSLYWLAAAAVLRPALIRRWPAWLVLPVVWVALEYVRGIFLVAFPWFHLAQTQYAQTRLIQIADVTGQYGVSFFVAMVNGLLLDLLRRLLIPPSREKGQAAALWGGAAAVVTAGAVLLGYGTWQLGRQTRQDGPIVGIVQQAIPISLQGREVTADEILDKHVAATHEFLGAAADLVIWPETMLPGGLNDEVVSADVSSLAGDDLRALAGRFFGSDAWRSDLDDATIREYLRPMIEGGKLPRGEAVIGRRQHAARMRSLARRLDCPILAGGAVFQPNPQPVDREDRWLVHNGAVWFDPGDRPLRTYAKVHLVPFSEYVPFKRSCLWLHRALRSFVPTAMGQLEPGTDYTRFELAPRWRRPPSGDLPVGRPDSGHTASGPARIGPASSGPAWRVVSPICYEGTFPGACRRMVYAQGRKVADIIANLSNDGWFVRRQWWPWGEGPYVGSGEQAQHLAHYCFRAVENRVPVVRAVNTGISASIDSNGRIVAQVARGELRTMVPGTLLLDGARRNNVEYLPGHGPRVLVDSRASWYSRLADTFAAAVGVAAAAMTAVLAVRRRTRQEGVNS